MALLQKCSFLFRALLQKCMVHLRKCSSDEMCDAEFTLDPKQLCKNVCFFCGSAGSFCGNAGHMEPSETHWAPSLCGDTLRNVCGDVSQWDTLGSISVWRHIQRYVYRCVPMRHIGLHNICVAMRHIGLQISKTYGAQCVSTHCPMRHIGLHTKNGAQCVSPHFIF